MIDEKLKQVVTIEIKSKNKDGSIKEHFKILPDGTKEVITNCQ